MNDPIRFVRQPVALAVLVCCTWNAHAQVELASAAADPGALSPVVVTGERSGGGVWRGAASIDVVDGESLRDGQAQINLSEGLAGVPGLVIRNRQNYAQDLQISVRGYGARATFGVRGVRLFVDGIPASAPDGSGQVANFPLGGADRIEVVRGPMAALYGASSGGALLLYTEDGQHPAQWRTGMVAGSDGLWRLSTQATGKTGAPKEPGWSYALDVSRFATDGARPQSAADRTNANLKLSRLHEGGRTVLVLNQHNSFALDPQGLTRAELSANPLSTNLAATTFNTRKSVAQTQLGLAFEQSLGNGHRLELMGYGGQRQVVQFQSIEPSRQTVASSGGVIDLDRDYWGWNARWRHEGDWQGGRLSLSAGLASDHQNDLRKGYENFTGTSANPTAIGVQGNLRRNEVNRASTLDPYVQAEWRSKDLTLMGGVRQTRTEYESSDRYVVAGNGDDSGRKTFQATLPVVGVRWQLNPAVQAFASVGKGYEIPTLNEVAYRGVMVSGFNTQLNAARSTSAEMGLRGRAERFRWNATAFDIRTNDEIVVASNTGGRAIFKNAGRTQRQGLELSGDWRLGPVSLVSALTWMQAEYQDEFETCPLGVCQNRNVPAGNRIPGLPMQQAFVQAAWDTGWAGSRVVFETRHVGRVMVNDQNSDSVAGHTLFNLGLHFKQDRGDWTLREFIRVDNLTDRSHVGSVIVNDGSSRFFEPGLGRKLLVGLEAQRRF